MLYTRPIQMRLIKSKWSNLLYCFLILFTFSACSIKTSDESSKNGDSELTDAKWIGAKYDSPIIDSLRYIEDPSPLFRKEFTIEKELKTATLYITAAGYYSGMINGKRLGKNYLDPAWTNFDKRIYFATYDLSNELIEGSNCIGIALGNGFYNPLPLKMFGNFNLKDILPSGNPAFIAKLKLEYKNGKTKELVTDESWKFSFGPIRKNNVYIGEVYNANFEISGWNDSSYDDNSWQNAEKVIGPAGKLEKAFFPPIQITDIKTPVSIKTLANGNHMVDMGVNFTGFYKIRLKGEKGDTITFRFGERIYEDGTLNPMTTVAGQIKKAGRGGPGAPPIAWQEDRYILGNNAEVWFTPEFTFHTYRYMEISGLRETPSIQDIEGLALNTNVEKNSQFTSSSERINAIQEITERTFLANLLSVQSDCPAREKFGYGGDLNATCEAFIYNYNMQDFYRKTVYDWVDAMNDSVFVDTAPFVGIKYCGISWESAFITTQNSLFQYYNDTAIVREMYELDLEWMEKAKRIHPKGLVEEGLSDHESLEPVPVELTGTSHYLQCARIMKNFASIMRDSDHEKEFEQLEQNLQSIVLEKYWKMPVAQPINKQTLFATLLYHDIIPEAEVDQAADSLLASLSAKSNHFITGIFGTKYILEALSKTGHIQNVFDVVNSSSYPGWGFMIEQGATTIWETWKESDNTYSNCHPMFGSVTEWFYRWLGGIRPMSDYPGFEKFIINPFIPNGLNQVSTSYETPFGQIVSNWKKEASGKQTYDFQVPNGSTALVELPTSSLQQIKVTSKNSKDSFIPELNKDQVFELKAGSYMIVIE